MVELASRLRVIFRSAAPGYCKRIVEVELTFVSSSVMSSFPSVVMLAPALPAGETVMSTEEFGIGFTMENSYSSSCSSRFALMILLVMPVVIFEYHSEENPVTETSLSFPYVIVSPSITSLPDCFPSI